DGTEVGGRAGSFDTQSLWLLHGGTYNGFDIGLSLEFSTTEGYQETVGADAQSFFDGAFGTAASRAPGPINTGRDMLDARLDIERGDWRLRGGYQGRYDMQTG